VSRCSAAPDDLRRLVDVYAEIDHRLRPSVRSLSASLGAARRSNSEGLGPVPEVDAEAAALLSACSALADRVAIIASAFEDADSLVIAAPTTSSGARIVSLPEDGLERAIRLRMLAMARAAFPRGGVFDLLANLHVRSREAWLRALLPPDCLGFGPDAYYSGGGFVVGPDGREYPLAIPNVRIGGRVYGSEVVVGKQAPVTSLRGRDAGWVTLGARTDVMRTDPKASGIEQFAIAAAGMNGNLQRRAEAADVGTLASLRVEATGIASIDPDTATPVGAAMPPSTDEVRAPVWLLVDGRLVEVDTVQAAPNREVRRSGLAAPSAGAARMGSAVAAADLLSQVASGVDLVANHDDWRHSAYQVRFEEHLDGRRRALLRTYNAARPIGESEYRVTARSAYYDDERLQYEDLRFFDGDVDTDDERSPE
jgi:hypothetical protein